MKIEGHLGAAVVGGMRERDLIVPLWNQPNGVTSLGVISSTSWLFLTGLGLFHDVFSGVCGAADEDTSLSLDSAEE